MFGQRIVIAGLSSMALMGLASAQGLDLQATLDQARSDNKIIGMGAIIMDVDGTYDIAVSGERIKGSNDPVQIDDAWHIGSNTKSITALLYAKLVENGLARWGATLPELFPDHAAAIDPAWNTITIEDLFAHRSGVEQLGGGWYNARRADKRSVIEQRLEASLKVLKKPPVKQIGAYDYNNLGYIIAGSVIEGLLGREAGEPVSWEEALQKYVLSEISFSDDDQNWGFGPPPEGVQGHRGAFGTSLFMSAVGTGPTADNPAALGPAGTLHATLLAHATLSREYLVDDSALILPSIREKLWTAFPKTDASSDYAMGWGIQTTERHGAYYGHGGSNTMWLSDIRIVPDYGIVVIVNSNQLADGAFDAHQDVLSAVLEHYETLE